MYVLKSLSRDLVLALLPRCSINTLFTEHVIQKSSINNSDLICNLSCNVEQVQCVKYTVKTYILDLFYSINKRKQY